MLKLRLPKLVALGAFALGVFSTAYADITPLRTGPVSQYGQLMAGKNADNEGRIYGSCEAYSTSGNEVQVKGMSLFWSNEQTQNRYWKDDVITGLVQKQGVQLIRAAMAVDNQGWGNGHYFVNGKTEYYQDLLDEVVESAIKNDIYVIIDFHSHTANKYTDRAKEFFKIQAKKWGRYDNVIFEIFNEPLCVNGEGDKSGNNCREYGGMLGMAGIKAYADEVIPIIRRYSDNLIVVGTPRWSSAVADAVGYPANDPLGNTAYTLHYYGGYTESGETHPFSSTSPDLAMQNGLSVFVTEWGAIGYDGGGTVSWNGSDQNNLDWLNWMDNKKLSSANWNAGYNGSVGGETASEYFRVKFDGVDASAVAWTDDTYSTSAKWVNQHVFAGLTSETYTQCGSYVALPALLDDTGYDGEFGDVYEDEVIPNDYVVEDFDGNGITQWTYGYVGGDWTSGNNGEKTFWDSERKSTVGGLVNLVTTEGDGYAGYGMHVSNLKGCQTLSYKYKGLKHNLDFANTDGDDLAVKTYSESSDWTTVEFDMSGIDASVVDLGSALDIKWVFEGPADGENFYVDDVVCGDPASGSNDPLVPPYMIDDFETVDDGYAWPYMFANGTTTIGNDENEHGYIVRFPEAAAPGSDYGIGLVGVTTTGTSWADAVLVKGVSGLSSGCSVISYQYKGGAHFFKAVDPALDVDAIDHDVHRISVGGSDSWKTVWIDVSDLKQWGHNDVLDLSKVTSLRWEMNNDKGSSNLTNVDLFVDNVRCAAEDEVREYVIDNFDGNKVSTSNYAYVHIWDDVDPVHTTIGNTPNGYEENSYEAIFADVGSGHSDASGIVDLSGPSGATLVMELPGLKGCEAVQYKYRGAAHKFMPVMDGDQGGTLSGNDFHKKEIGSPSDDWKTEVVLISDLAQDGWGTPIDLDLANVAQLRWDIEYDEDYKYIYVDDVECVKAPEQRICDAEYCEYNITSQFDFAYAGDGWTIENESDGNGNIYGHFYDANDDKTYFGMLNAVAPAGGGWAGAGINVENLNQCRILSYKYKGFEHDLTFQNEPANGDPSYGMLVPASDSWREVTFDLSNLKGTDLGASLNIRWQKHGAGEGTLYVDDIRCVTDAEPENSNSSVSYEEYLVADFEDGGDKKSTGDYVYRYEDFSLGNASCGVGCYEHTLAEAAHTGTYGAALTGITNSGLSGWGGAAINVMVPDLEGCKILQYSFKGAAHGVKLRKNEVDDNSIWVGYYDAKTAWDTAYISLVEFAKKNSLAEVSDIRFVVDALEGSGPDYLYVDDVKCVLYPRLPKPGQPTTNPQLVDDFEDGDHLPLWPGLGNWWVDKAGPYTKDTTKFAKGSQSSKSLQVNFVLDEKGITYDPYMAISSNDFDNMNLTNCTEVRYDYKGAAHKFRIKFSEEINNLLDLGWNFHSFEVANRSESWQTVTIPLSSLRQQWCDENSCTWGSYVPLDTIMRRVNGFDWRVDGKTGTHDSLAIDNIRCIGLAETQYYTVTFKNGEETYAEKSWAEGSNVPDPEGTPTKASTAQYDYTFNYWAFDEYEFDEDKQQYYLDANGKRIPIRRVTADAIHEAVYDSVTRAYTITFLYDDGLEVATYDVDYGTSIADFAPVDLTKASTNEYTYSFAGWSPDTMGVTVTGDASFTAVFNGTKNQYCITFVDVDGTTLKAEECYDYGTLVADIDVPNVQDKSASEKFAGWTPGLATVTEDVVYEAVYTNLNIITWKDYDGSVLHQDYLANGATLNVYLGPERPATAEWSYTFDHWTPAVVTQVSGDATYTAVYDSTKNQYYVAFVDENGDEIGVASGVYDYGTNVSSVAPTPTKASTTQWTYAFTGWSPAITEQTTVTGAVTYTAQFSATENSYTVTFDCGEGAQNVPAARTAVYGTGIASLLPAEDPFKAATDASTFEFVKWTYADGTDIDVDDELVGNVTLKAVFTEFVRRYAVTFIDYDNTVLKAATLYDYGAIVEVPDDPTRDAAGIYTYEFRDWNPAVTAVTGEAVYKATYDSTAHYGAIAVSEVDGKMRATIEGSYKGADKVEINEDIVVDTVAFTRTFNVGKFSTIVLPFSIAVSAVEGAEFYTITGFEKAEGTDTWKQAVAQKVPVTGTLAANTPYLVNPTAETMVFHGEATLRTSDAPNSTFSEGAWEFRGAYNYFVFGDSADIFGRAYGFTAEESVGFKAGEFARAGSTAWIPPMRAYLVYNNGTSSAKSSVGGTDLSELPETLDVILVDEKGTTIGGGSVNTVTGQFRMDHWYDLQGRKLKGKPTTKGTYYHNGKMVIVK